MRPHPRDTVAENVPETKKQWNAREVGHDVAICNMSQSYCKALHGHRLILSTRWNSTTFNHPNQKEEFIDNLLDLSSHTASWTLSELQVFL